MNYSENQNVWDKTKTESNMARWNWWPYLIHCIAKICLLKFIKVLLKDRGEFKNKLSRYNQIVFDSKRKGKAKNKVWIKTISFSHFFFFIYFFFFLLFCSLNSSGKHIRLNYLYFLINCYKKMWREQSCNFCPSLFEFFELQMIPREVRTILICFCLRQFNIKKEVFLLSFFLCLFFVLCSTKEKRKKIKQKMWREKKTWPSQTLFSLSRIIFLS